MTVVAPYPGHITFTWPGSEASDRSGLSGCRMPSHTTRMDDFICSIHCMQCMLQLKMGCSPTPHNLDLILWGVTITLIEMKGVIKCVRGDN